MTVQKPGGGLFTPRNIILALVALGLLCCICAAIVLGAIFIVNSTSSSFTIAAGNLSAEQAKVGQAGIDFMTKLKNGDWAGAYSLCTPDLQRELQSAPELSKRITTGNAQPQSGVFTDISSISASTAEAQIDGTVVLAGSRSGTLRLVLDRVGGGWQVSGFNLKPN